MRSGNIMSMIPNTSIPIPNGENVDIGGKLKVERM
jgi:hypothetical protein